MRKLEEAVFKALVKASTSLPPDVEEALKQAYRLEASPQAKLQLKNILDNVELARRLGKPLCQDTGIVSFFVKGKVDDWRGLEKALRKATIKATEEAFLRPNAVHPLTRENTGNNVGVGVPAVTWLPGSFDTLEITVVLKGAGSENLSFLKVLPPGEGVEEVKRLVLRAVAEAGGKPCPPIVLNLGLGGTVDLTAKLAKLALIRPLGVRHGEEEVASLERELLRLINKLGVGPMGLGGRTTALDVKIEYAHCHTASLPVAVNFQCWADRRATVRLHPDGSVEVA